MYKSDSFKSKQIPNPLNSCYYNRMTEPSSSRDTAREVRNFTSRLKCIKANMTIMPVPKQPTIRRSKRGDEKELKNIIGDDGT